MTDTKTRVFEATKFAVDRIPVETNDGGTVDRHVVVHPGAVVVLPVMDDGRVVLIRNERFTIGETLLELCAGTLEPEEDPAECAARELREETGFEAASIRPLLRFYATPGISDERMHVFEATDLRHVGQQLDATEHIEVQAYDRKELDALLRDGEIVDGKTIAALLWWQRYGHTADDRRA